MSDNVQAHLAILLFYSPFIAIFLMLVTKK